MILKSNSKLLPRRIIKALFLIAFILIFLLGDIQSQSMEAFENLVNKTWIAEGKWGDGSLFRQEVYFSFDLNGKIVKAKSKGFIDQKQEQFGERNHGIRSYNNETKAYEFVEFDVFGGITKGELVFEGKSVIYNYTYGGSQLQDRWDFVNDSTYTFKVLSLNQGEENSIYLETVFKEVKRKDDIHAIGQRLVGKWVSKAWDGSLEEDWERSGDSYTQKAAYFESGIAVYEAQNFLEFRGNELILTTLIKNGNPKIFKAISIDEDQVVFENKDYSNPSKLTYTFIKDGFSRRIEGLENGKKSTYLFEFKPR